MDKEKVTEYIEGLDEKVGDTRCTRHNMSVRVFIFGQYPLPILQSSLSHYPPITGYTKRVTNRVFCHKTHMSGISFP